jgi:hypothetical protein
MADVDVALVLAVDCSSSVDAGDFRLQMDGIAAALRQKAVLTAITAGASKRVAISLVQWSTSNKQSVSVPWKLLSTASDVEVVARLVETALRDSTPGGTGLAASLLYSTALLAAFPLRAERRVIDVSGDGEENDNGDVATARALALRRGVVINGLPIISGSELLEPYYRREVIGGDGAFIEPARNILDFGRAMQQKLLRELTPKVT